jgi:hypothetical protein
MAFRAWVGNGNTGMSYRSLTFPNGRPAITSLTITRQRPLPVGATPLVSVGERVTPERVIAEQRVERGVRGVLAGMAGQVTSITVGRSVTIEGIATLLSGAIGVGGPAAGALYTIPRGESLAVAHIPHGCVLLHPTRAPLMLLQRAMASGAVGVIAASATALELEAFARADLMMLLEGLAPPTAPQPLTIVLTEGVGEAVMDSILWHLLVQRLGNIALLNGQTLPQHAIRPEILLSLPEGSMPLPAPLPSDLAVGALVRVWSGSTRGAHGRITHLFAHERVSSASQWEPCAQIRLDDGTTQIVPLQLLDVVG